MLRKIQDTRSVNIDKNRDRLERLSEKKIKGWSLYEIMLVSGCIIAFIIMYIRAFYGTEITDEAYYVSNTMAILHGNLPFAYNNEAMTFGANFMLIPQLFVYELFVPSFKGVFLFTRLSFVTFKAGILYVIYRILRRHYQRKHILLALAILIPYSAGIANYGYNSVAAFLMLLSVVFLYEAIEHQPKKAWLYIIVSGFLASWAFFAHIAYAVAILLCLGIILWRSCRGQRAKNIIFYAVGGFSEVFIIFIPIMLHSGTGRLFDGIIGYRYYTFPIQPSSDLTWRGRLQSIINIGKPYLFLSVFLIVVVSFFIHRYVSEKREKYNLRESICVSLILSFIICIYVLVRRNDYIYWINNIGVIVSMYIIILIFLKIIFQDSLMIYMSLYPAIFALCMAVLTGSNDPIARFGAVIPAIPAVVLLGMESRRELIRLLTTIAVIMCIFLTGYAQCKYVYRDGYLSSLRYRVEEGVYSGIYTTEQRAKDLPEMEAYLNSAIGKDDLYAFRDNVPFAYLMNRKGKMCDLNTWDCLHYTYKGNMPAGLFSYYKRVGEIPDKIIYIDFGRDETLSIDDPSFRYNEFVNAFYTLAEDFKLNDTFFHIKVYKKTGDVNGNYDYWIDTYYDLPE